MTWGFISDNIGMAPLMLECKNVLWLIFLLNSKTQGHRSLSLLEAKILQKDLKVDTRPKGFPLNYHNITGQILISENVRTKSKLKEIWQFSEKN